MKNVRYLFDFKQNRNIWKLLLGFPNTKLQENPSPGFSLLHDKASRSFSQVFADALKIRCDCCIRQLYANSYVISIVITTE